MTRRARRKETNQRGRPKRAGEQGARQDEQRRAEDEGDDREHDAADDGIDVEALDRDRQAGLPELDRSGGFLMLLSLGLLLVVEFLQRILDRLAALGDLGWPGRATP